MTRRLTDEETVPVMKAAGLTPLEPYPGNGGRPWSCLCGERGSEVTPSYESIKRGRGGCKLCGIQKRSAALVDYRLMPQDQDRKQALKPNIDLREPRASL